MSRSRRLLVSIHDVTPFHAQRLEKLVPLVEGRVGAGNFALLAVPDFHGEGRIDSDRAFAARLRGWSNAGCEVFLHGHRHRDTAYHIGAVARLKARHLTAREGEFLGLDHATATALLIDGRKRVEDVIGRSVAGFIAPAWLYGRDALRAIADLRFPIAEDHFRVWHPPSGRVLARGPVITYASRTPTRMLSSLAWSRAASLLLRSCKTVRLGVHPHDVDALELVREIGRALRAFSKSHQPSRYADLLAQPAAAKCGNASPAASEPV
jgi:predicted deacetylase